MTRFSTALSVAVVGLTLTTSALAANFSASGAGGNIPDVAAAPGTWNVSYTGTPFSSTASVPNAVTSITAVKLNGFTHTWRGDLHIILKDPANVAHNIVVRPGSSGTTVGNSGDYLLGNYTFVETGGGNVNATGNISGGSYNQFFNTGTGMWTNGIANTPLSGITGPAGNWTLEIRDWAAGDIGSLTGWVLEGTDASGSLITSYCGAGDAGVTTPCAGPSGAPGNGCANSGNANGASLTAAGDPATDTVVFTQSGELATSLSIVLQGDANIPAGTPFGDGVRCAGGSLKRLYTKNAVGGVVTAPQGGDPSVKTASANLGDVIPAGGIRYYQIYYRDPASVSGLNFNVGNALQITWQ